MKTNLSRRRFYVVGLFILIVFYIGGCGGSAPDTKGTSSHTFTLKGSSSQSASSDESPMIQAAVSPSSVLITIYKAWISASDTCSNPIEVFSNDSGKTFDMTSSPTITTTSVPEGTYPCVIAQISDQIRYTPSASEGSCASGTEYTRDICREDEGSPRQSIDPDGNITTCTGTETNHIENRLTVYISTLSTNDPASDSGGENEFFPPTTSDPSRGIKLSNALVVNSDKTGIFYTDFSNKITGAESECDLNPPIFGFR